MGALVARVSISHKKYYAIPKIIRGQLSYVILLRIREKLDFRRLLRDCGIPLELDELENIYKDATNKETSFLKIDLTTIMMIIRCCLKTLQDFINYQNNINLIFYL